MAQHWTDWSDQTANQAPADWTDEWGSATWTVVEDEAATGGKRLTQTGLALAFKALSWDDVGDVADAEIVAKVRVGGTATVDYRAGVYVRGATGDTNRGYWLGLYQGIQLRLRKIDGANNTPIASASFSWDNNTWYWLRLRAEGSALKAKVWADGDAEPGTWTIETTDNSYSTGWVGVGDRVAGGAGAAANSWDVVGVGTGGDPAPTEEPSATVDLDGSTDSATDTDASLTVARPLDGASGSASTADGDLDVTTAVNLDGSSDSATTLDGDLTVARAFSGSSDSVTTLDAALGLTLDLDGSSDSATLLDGTLTAIPAGDGTTVTGPTRVVVQGDPVDVQIHGSPTTVLT